MEKLIRDILSKKELQNLDKNLVKEFVEIVFKRDSSLKKKLEEKNYNKKSEEYKKVFKEVRKNLREIYGVFNEGTKGKKNIILKKTIEGQTEETLLEMHTSTKERLPYYKEVYTKIFSITGIPSTIMDLACGLNPLSYKWLGCRPTYIASDISTKDMKFIEQFFKKSKIKGKSIKIDLVTEQEKVEDLEADICFLFKTLDSLELRKRQTSKSLINKINAKWIVISFSKISLGGNKPIHKTKRQWIINFLQKNNFHYKEFEVKNEFFLVIKNKKSEKLLSYKRKK